jgi:hypothetical protein
MAHWLPEVAPIVPPLPDPELLEDEDGDAATGAALVGAGAGAYVVAGGAGAGAEVANGQKKTTVTTVSDWV